MNSQPMPDVELHKVLEPQFHSGTFIFGKNLDDSPRTWKMQPLAWRYEKNFRKHVMPMLAITYRPFELFLGAYAARQGLVAQVETSVIKSLFDAETEIDEYLVNSMHAILIAQDQTITREWVEEQAQGRDQLLEIIDQQCQLHKIMDRLGELLAERLGKLAQMMGVKIDLPTLKRLWKQVSENLSARITTLLSTADNVTGHYTVSSSETTSQNSKPNGRDNVTFVGQ